MKNGWQKLRLQEAYWFQEGPGVRKWQFTDGGIKLLNVANVTKLGGLDLSKTVRYLSEEEIAQRYSHFLVDEGDLVIASSGISFDEDGFLRTRGAFVQREHLPLCMNTSTIRFKAKRGLSDLRFLKYWLDSKEFRTQITRLVTGSAQQNFGPSHLNQIAISIPSLPEQQRIAAILDKADVIRRKRQTALQLTEELLRSAFLEIFGDPVTNPKGWPVITFDEAVPGKGQIVDGPFGSSLKPECYVTQGVRVIRNYNIHDEHFDASQFKYVTPEKFEEIRRSEVKASDILISTKGTIGDVCLMPALEGESVLSATGTVRIRLSTKNTTLLPEFVVSQMTTSRYKAYIKQQESGTNQKYLTLAMIRSLQLINPPLELQQQYCQLKVTSKKTLAKLTQAQQLSETFFHALVQCAFRGEL